MEILLALAALATILALVCAIWARRKPQPVRIVEPASPSPHVREKEPYWITFDDYQARAEQLKSEWDIKAPTPEGAQKYLREGWERDEIDESPVVMGGKQCLSTIPFLILEFSTFWGYVSELSGLEQPYFLV